MAFNPNDHIIKLKGKDYLEVKWRLVWFRDDHPDWGIETNVVHYDEKKAVVQARIINMDGHLMAMGTKSETPQGFADYLEKSETGAVGRALGMLGYGTQFAPEFDEGERIVDSPVQSKQPTTIVDAAKHAFGAENVKIVDEKPAQTDGVHPNKNKSTTAFMTTLHGARGRLGWTEEQLDAEAGKFLSLDKPVSSLYDLGNTTDNYRKFLAHLNNLWTKQQTGGNA